MKRPSTIERTKIVRDLNNIDCKLKFTNSHWNDRVKEAFNNTGSFSFEDLAYADLYTAKSLLYDFFKR
jgi:hypothetical protein